MEWEKAYTKDQSGLTADERVSSLFQPDTLLSAQYFDNLRRRTHLEPEKRLMLAILEDAVACFQDNLLAQNVKNQRLFQDTEEWITETDGDRVFSFESVCESLGISPDYVRRGLLRWKQKRLSKDADTEVWERKKLAG